MNELDHILLEQWLSARKRHVRIRRLRRVLHAPEQIEYMEKNVIGNITFFETMISDKSLLKKRKKVKRYKSEDILYRHPLVCYYRNLFILVSLAFELLNYHLSLWNKKER